MRPLQSPKKPGPKTTSAYKGIIDRVEINMERPTDDMDLMLEIEQAHYSQ